MSDEPTNQQTADTEDEVTPGASANERRGAVRVSVDRLIEIHLTSGEIVKGKLVNLSTSGIAIAYPAPAEKGSKLQLKFQLPTKSDMVNIVAIGIAHHSHVQKELFITGIEFTSISEEHTRIIKEFVEMKAATQQKLTGLRVSHRHRD